VALSIASRESIEVPPFRGEEHSLQMVAYINDGQCAGIEQDCPRRSAGRMLRITFHVICLSKKNLYTLNVVIRYNDISIGEM
jgi:hypothetical protein